VRIGKHVLKPSEAEVIESAVGCLSKENKKLFFHNFMEAIRKYGFFTYDETYEGMLCVIMDYYESPDEFKSKTNGKDVYHVIVDVYSEEFYYPFNETLLD
jgi:hypothetical protein